MENNSLMSLLSKYDNTQEPRTQNVNVHVKEYKAPTDESIKILREIEQKAVENIIHKVEVKNNVTTCCVVFFQDMLLMSGSDKISVKIKFKLNGVDYIINEDVDRYEFQEEMKNKGYGNFGHKKVYQAFYNMVSRLITIEIMKQDGFSELAERVQKSL